MKFQVNNNEVYASTGGRPFDKNKPLMTKLRDENSKHEIEKVGKGLRSMFSWLK